MKNKIYHAMLLVMMMLSLMGVGKAEEATPVSTAVTENENAFLDVPPTNPNFVAIRFLKGTGLLAGYSDGSFKPDQLVNRAESLKVLLAGNGIEIPGTFVETGFPDVKVSDWFAKFVAKGKEIGIIQGNGDGTFAPARNVNRAEFLKMLLTLNNFITVKWDRLNLFADVPADAWFTPFLNYAGKAGLLSPDDQNMLFPARELTRGEVAEIMYLMLVIRNDHDTQFLLNQAEAQMAQIDIYVGDNRPDLARRASNLAVDISQQAYLLNPTNPVVLGAAKLARAYDYLMSAYFAAVQADFTAARIWIDKTISKAAEAAEADADVEVFAQHIKDRANELLAQFPAS